MKKNNPLLNRFATYGTIGHIPYAESLKSKGTPSLSHDGGLPCRVTGEESPLALGELELAGRESLGLEGRGRRRRMGGGGGMAAGVGGWVEVLFGLEGRRGGKC
eukprot:CCRYP_020464-RC/>CCRYP_020464-RC protein AED:0.47 eAED:0.93 QI:0/0/0/1/0/0/3/0/103